MFSGVYEIVNTVNGKRYIGSAVNFVKRWCNHKDKLRQNKHYNRHLQAAWNKHGGSAFEFRKLLICKPEHLLMYEQLCLDGFCPEYNLVPTAGSCLGAKRSPEACKRNGDLKRGKRLSESQRTKLSEALRGNTYARGRKYTPEQLDAHRTRCSSLEHKAKLSAALRGKKRGPLTDECKAKLSAAKRGKKRAPFSAAWKARIAAAGVGRRHTQETRLKMSVVQKLRFQREGVLV